jgi:hypothetical protein
MKHRGQAFSLILGQNTQLQNEAGYWLECNKHIIWSRHMILWICIDWSRKRCLHRRRVNTRLPLCMILALLLHSKQQEFEHLKRTIGTNWSTWWNISEASACCHSCLVPTELAFWSGGWMQHL